MIFHLFFQSIFFINLIVMICSIIFGGIVINIYGELCGLNPLSYQSWINIFLFSNSPWCKMLNYLSWLSLSINEHIIYFYISSLLGFIYNITGIKHISP
jgi:hypothetical protein